MTCATVRVPLDRSNGTPGQVKLIVERRPATARPRNGAVFAFAGGPGQAATPFVDFFARVLAPALRTRDLVVFDQRGTGFSGFLRCRGDQEVKTLGVECARGLGAGLHHYGTAETVEDVEAVRQAVGIEKIVLYGVSYGTFVAESYARRYPDHVASLVLDSVVLPTGDDPFDRTTYQAIPRVLADVCAGGGCVDVRRDLAAVIRRILSGHDRVRIVSYSGKPRSKRVTTADLFAALQFGMAFDSIVRSRFPSALHAVIGGDTYPLGRLLVAVNGETTAPLRSSDVSFSRALNSATTCDDTILPWDRIAPRAIRLAQAKALLATVPPQVFAPFDRSSALHSDIMKTCLPWPTVPQEQVEPALEPDVPVLVLAGVDDPLTPLADAQAAAAEFPHATLVAVPDSGHSVFTASFGGPRSNGTPCVERSVRSFFAARPVAPCPPVPHRFGPVPPPPRSLREVRAWSGMPGRIGLTIRAVLLTLNDVTLSALSPLSPLTGLRGGTFGGVDSSFTLDHVGYVPGVFVSGHANLARGSGSFTISGSASRGTLTVGPHGRIVGILDGRAIETHRP